MEHVHAVTALLQLPPGRHLGRPDQSVFAGQRRTATPERRTPPRRPSETRHGSGARLSSPAQAAATTTDEQRRERSRDRPMSASAQARERERAAEDQLLRGTLTAIDRLEVAVAALDAASRNHAHTISGIDARLVELHNRENDQSANVTDTELRARQTETHLAEACSNILQRFQTKLQHSENNDMVNARIAPIGQELLRLESAIAAAISVDSETPVRGTIIPLTFHDMSTPGQRGADPMQRPAGDPWRPPTAAARQAQAPNVSPQTFDSFGPTTEDQARMAANGVSSPQAVPPSWVGPGAAPSMQPAGFQTPPAREPTPATPEPPQPGPFLGSGNKVAYMGDQDAMQRKSGSVRRFTRKAEDFVNWAKHMVDHMAKVHPHWRYLLEWVAPTNQDMGMTRLANEVLGPFNENARDLAIKLEQTVADHLPEYLYNKRIQLCGGREEASNGFNMRIRLHRENVGDSEVIEYAGTECLRTYGKRTKRSEVSEHIDGWISLFDRYGQELADAHRMTRNMFLNILPKEMKDKINDDPKLNGKGFREMAVWVRNQVLQERQEAIAEVTEKCSLKNLAAARFTRLPLKKVTMIKQKMFRLRPRPNQMHRLDGPSTLRRRSWPWSESKVQILEEEEMEQTLAAGDRIVLRVRMEDAANLRRPAAEDCSSGGTNVSIAAAISTLALSASPSRKCSQKLHTTRASPKISGRLLKATSPLLVKPVTQLELQTLARKRGSPFQLSQKPRPRILPAMTMGNTRRSVEASACALSGLSHHPLTTPQVSTSLRH